MFHFQGIFAHKVTYSQNVQMLYDGSVALLNHWRQLVLMFQ